MATYSSNLVWRIPRTEEPGGLQSTVSQRVRHNWATKTRTVLKQEILIIMIKNHSWYLEGHLLYARHNAVCSTHRTFAISLTTLRGRGYCYPRCSDGKTEAQRHCPVLCLCNWYRLESTPVWPQAPSVAEYCQAPPRNQPWPGPHGQVLYTWRGSSESG